MMPAAMATEAGTTNARPALRRDQERRVIAGVCAGIAGRLDLDPLVVRIVFVAAAAAGRRGPVPLRARLAGDARRRCGRRRPRLRPARRARLRRGRSRSRAAAAGGPARATRNGCLVSRRDRLAPGPDRGGRCIAVAPIGDQGAGSGAAAQPTRMRRRTCAHCAERRSSRAWDWASRWSSPPGSCSCRRPARSAPRVTWFLRSSWSSSCSP